MYKKNYDVIIDMNDDNSNETRLIFVIEEPNENYVY